MRNLRLRCVFLLKTWPGFTAFRSGPNQAEERAGSKRALPIVAMSSDRLFLDRVGRHQCPSPLHRHGQNNMRFAEPQAKGDVSTLPARGHFYFALTLVLQGLTSAQRSYNILTPML